MSFGFDDLLTGICLIWFGICFSPLSWGVGVGRVWSGEWGVWSVLCGVLQTWDYTSSSVDIGTRAELVATWFQSQ